MGIDYSGGIIVGCYGDEIQNEEYRQNSSEFIEKYDLNRMSPWYDADDNDCIIGIKLTSRWSLVEIQKLVEQFEEAKKKLEPLFGTVVFLFGTQHIYQESTLEETIQELGKFVLGVIYLCGAAFAIGAVIMCLSLPLYWLWGQMAEIRYYLKRLGECSDTDLVSCDQEFTARGVASLIAAHYAGALDLEEEVWFGHRDDYFCAPKDAPVIVKVVK